MRLTLRTKILLLIAGTAVGLVSVILLAFTLLVSREMDRAVRDDVRATGGVLAQLLRERSAVLLSQAQIIADDPPLHAALTTRDPATVLDTVQDYQRKLSVEAVIVTDRDGRVLADTDGTFPAHAALASDAGVAAALDNRPWSGIKARQGRLMLTVCVPVKIGSDLYGTFTTFRAIDPAAANSLHDALGTEIAFLDHGRVVGASCPLPATLPTPGIPTVISVAGVRYFALYAALPTTNPDDGMGFETLRPYAAATRLYRRCLVVFLAASLLTLLLALGVGAWTARSLTRPLDGVVQAAKTLRGGGWPDRFEGHRSDEIGLLQTVFNEMTVSLRGSQERLLALIDTDLLTGLDNHRRFQERLEMETTRCSQSGESLSLLLLDLDNFQVFNQKHGHAAGDRAVRETAQSLQRLLPEIAIAARYGGEEFAVLLPQRSLSQAEALAERIRAVIEEIGLEEDGGGLTLSVGCAEFGTHSAEGAGLLLAAELAVSRAKQLGRNRVCRFDTLPGADINADPYQLHRFLKDESLSTIQALAAAVDAKDAYTQGHSQRVARYAVALAQRIGLPDSEVDLVHITGTLHDVGKIGVPDSILKKPKQLDDDERRIMETHPALGEVIIRKAPKLAATLPGVRHHHERWDGGGYPDKISGEQIPQIARILAVADTFDAMTSDRPYRKGLSWEIALSEIAKGAGTQFEPLLSEAFVALMQADFAERKLA
jgi:diguanylate cyclase (GGDEF)-like protein